MRTHIHSVSATSGFLQDCRVEFSPKLNCIIGARGTCKSTLLESIRFAYDHDKRRIAELTELGGIGKERGMIRATLGPGSVRCEISSENSNSLDDILIERELDANPRITVAGVREHSDYAILGRIEIFSQGHLQRIAESNELRISLIDRPNAEAIEHRKTARADAGEALMRIGSDLRGLRAQIVSLNQELQPTEALRQQLQETESSRPELSPELEKERVLFEARRRFLALLRDSIEVQSAVLNSVRDLPGIAHRLQTIVTTLESHPQSEAEEALARLAELRTKVASIQNSVVDISKIDLGEAVRITSAAFERSNEAFYELRQQQQNVNEFLKRQQYLKQQVEVLEKRAIELSLLREKEAALLQARQIERAKIKRIDNEIYEYRVSEVDSINAEHADRVHLALLSSGSAPEQVRFLSEMLAGSRIRAQDEVAAALVSVFSPADLVDLIEAGDSQQLATVLNRDLGQMNRVIAHLSDQPDLYRLEAMSPKPRLEITFYDEGVPKPVESLSKGQKATALLPLILRPLPYPLLIDQPEDDLDNSFIFRYLIRTVEQLKDTRQIIFVTHNANIPVLGGAERVVVMSMRSPTDANLPVSGTVDECKQEILELLEGGAEAFRIREKKYHDLLPS